MKYFINYMTGSGPNEKTQIRIILDSIKTLPKVNLGNLDRLKDDIIKIQRFDPSLLPDEMEPKVERIISEYETNILKNENLNRIKSDLESILRKRANQITPQVVDDANILKNNYVKINSEIKEYNDLFDESRKIVDDILKDKGSLISDFSDFAEDFGFSGKTVTREQNIVEEEDEELDFM